MKIAHIALWTKDLERAAAFWQRIFAAPRWTGDGFYEAVIADPDAKLIEITA
jgi:lactoylglutathione lyase